MAGRNGKITICIYGGASWEEVYGNEDYRTSRKEGRFLSLPLYVNYARLYTMVCDKLKLANRRQNILMFCVPSKGQVIKLDDDDDVACFISQAVEMKPEMGSLYVVCEDVKVGNGSGTVSTQVEDNVPVVLMPNSRQYQSKPFGVSASNNDSSRNAIESYFADFLKPSMAEKEYNVASTTIQDTNHSLHSGHVTENYYTSETMFFHENEIYGTSYVPESGYVVGTSNGLNNEFSYRAENSELADEDDTEESSEKGSDEESDASENEHILFIKRNMKDYDDDDDEINSERGGAGRDLFWGNPPPLDDQVDPPRGSRENVPVSRVQCFQTFEDKKALQLAIGLKSIEENFQTRTTKSATDRLDVKCDIHRCTWHLHATKMRGGCMFTVRTMVDEHTCSRTAIIPKHRNANRVVLGHILAETMADIGRVYRPKEIIRDINLRFHVHLKYYQAYRAKNHALNLLRGTPEHSFVQLPIYCHNLKTNNPGTVTHIKTDALGRFECLFIAIGVAIKTFKDHLRQVLILDGAHLKGRYLGTMLLAVAMDGNNRILPVAFGVAKSESGHSWKWFLGKLKECIGEFSGGTIISDRAKSIDLACKTIFPTAEHVICCRHLLMNIGLKKGDDDQTWVFWAACKAYTVKEFEKYMKRLRLVAPGAAKKLDGIDPKKWTRAKSIGHRYNMMTSNSAESINALTVNARKLPVTQLVEYIRETMQQWWHQRRLDGVAFKEPLTPWAGAKVQKKIYKSQGWVTQPISAERVVVKEMDGSEAIVNLADLTCSCRKWQLSVLPCGHAIRSAYYYGQADVDFMAGSYYKSETYVESYKESVEPVGSEKQWELPDEIQKVLPPTLEKRQSGRPKNKDRILSKGEERKKKKCGSCKGLGHSRRSCPTPKPAKIPIVEPSNGRSGSCSRQKTHRSQTDETEAFTYPTVDLYE